MKNDTDTVLLQGKTPPQLYQIFSAVGLTGVFDSYGDPELQQENHRNGGPDMSLIQHLNPK